jgi:Icc-related predicted phosphoesterase
MSQGSMARTTRIFFVADIHGSALCFRKFVNAASAYRADVLLVGGDISAKTLTPLFPEDGGWTVSVEGARRTARTVEEVALLEARLRDEATVPFRTTVAEWDELLSDRRKADAVFERLELEELRRWLGWARERLGSSSTRLLLGLGNDDLDSMEDVIEADERAELTDREILWIDDHHELLTLPYSNPTPWDTNRELSEAEIEQRLTALSHRLRDPSSAIFNIHVPPHGTPIDLAPRLTADLTKVMTPGGEPDMIHVGSTSVRAVLQRSQPLLSLHGHIHESKGFLRLGRTDVINPGSAYTEGTLLGAVIDLAPDKVRSYALTAG